MKNKSKEDHQQRINELTVSLTHVTNCPSLESISQVKNIADQLLEISGCLYNKYFKPLPMVIKQPYSIEELAEFFNEAIRTGKDYKVIREDGKVGLSGGTAIGFDCSICPVCYDL